MRSSSTLRSQISRTPRSIPRVLHTPSWRTTKTGFLDPQDFVSPGNSNPNAIPYPAQLEPPRGWCPAKKKDLKERGGEPWPEGQEPRLRCTFCRRTYAGVNAKSMWRRHVYEKHKIAMANRRDTANPDRSRRRAGNSAFCAFQCNFSAYTDRPYRGKLEVKGRKDRGTKNVAGKWLRIRRFQ
jgi:hypothetical protein